MTATKDSNGKVYVRLDNGQVMTLKTFYKHYPKYVLHDLQIQKELNAKKEVKIYE